MKFLDDIEIQGTLTVNGTEVNGGKSLTVANNLTTSSYDSSNPVALSAYQGYLLNQKLGTQCNFSLSGTTLTITPK